MVVIKQQKQLWQIEAMIAYWSIQSILTHTGNKCYEAKIEESEKAGSH